MVQTIALSPRMQAGFHMAERPSAARIAAISGMLAVHVAALMLLLMPMAAPVPQQRISADTPDIPYQPVPLRQPDPVPQPEQPRLRPDPAPARVQPRLPAPAVDAPVLSSQGEYVVPGPGPVIDAAPTADATPPAGPSLRLQSLQSPAPDYPREALRQRVEGLVTLEVRVGTDGHPLDVRVYASSGNRALDDAARRQVLRRWLFQAATRDGMPVESVGLVEINFQLR